MRSVVLLLAALAVTPTAFAGPVAIGDRLVPFKLKDQTGKAHDLASVKGRSVVLIFIATQCPVSNAYNERMAAVARDYAAKGVAFYGINSNKQEPVEEIAEHAQKHGFSFPVLKDPDNVQADHFGAQVTPEAYVYDAAMVLRYHGRIDDDRGGSNVKSTDLKNALDALLAGKEVPVKETKAFGCTIKRVQK